MPGTRTKTQQNKPDKQIRRKNKTRRKESTTNARISKTLREEHVTVRAEEGKDNCWTERSTRKREQRADRAKDGEEEKKKTKREIRPISKKTVLNAATAGNLGTRSATSILPYSTAVLSVSTAAVAPPHRC